MPTHPNEDRPLWKRIAEDLEARAAHPSAQQYELAERIGCELPDTPAPVATVILRVALAEVFDERFSEAYEIPEELSELEQLLGVDVVAQLHTGTKAEVGAWYNARYKVLTARGLRALEPEPGDAVTIGTQTARPRIISSVGSDGRIYLKGRPSASAWPNHLTRVARRGEAGYDEAFRAADAASLNAMRYSPENSANFRALEQYIVEDVVPTPEAIRALEELMESGERREERFQQVLTAHPALLASLVIGNWQTYVIPKVRLGSEFVPDYLVLGLNSLGPQWLTVEIEAPHHRIEIASGDLSQATRHAVRQVVDWRDWLTDEIAYAQRTLGLYGLTNRAPGLVIIGRSEPSMERASERSRSGEDSDIAIHSWDWLLRNARNFTRGYAHSDFARRTLDAMRPDGFQAASLAPRGAAD